MTDYALSDIHLSRRLERCEGKANAAFVASRAKLHPHAGAASLERAGTYALFDGPGSPLTQTFALGIFTTPSAEDLDAIEHFYEERGAAAMHEVSPLVSMETIELLTSRGYRPVELTSVLHRPIGEIASTEGRVSTRIANDDELDRWSEVAGEGWSETPEASAFVREIGRVAAASEGSTAFFAEIDGRAVGTGMLSMYDGVAILAGASTIPPARKQGAQRALLETRLRHAAQQGCDLAMMGALPGSASQRNAERQGFRIAYTRIKWGR